MLKNVRFHSQVSEHSAPSYASSTDTKMSGTYGKNRCILTILGVALLGGIMGIAIVLVSGNRGGRESNNNNNDNGSSSSSAAFIWSREDYNLYGPNMKTIISAQDVMTQWECLDLCTGTTAQESDGGGAYYNTWYHTCECFSNVECLAPTGTAVEMDDYSVLTDGLVFSKLGQDTEICTSDWCTLDGDKHPYCFTASKQSRRDFNLYGTNMIETTVSNNDVMSEWECLNHCVASEGVIYVPREEGLGVTSKSLCTCLDNIDCLAPTGWLSGRPAVDLSLYSIQNGIIFFKNPTLQTCPNDWCTMLTSSQTSTTTTSTATTTTSIAPNPYCFSGSKSSRKQLNLYGSNLTQIYFRDEISNDWDCLNYCTSMMMISSTTTTSSTTSTSSSSSTLPLEGIYYNTHYKTCECYSGVECLAPTTENINPFDMHLVDDEYTFVAPYRRKECDSDLCTLDPNHSFCK